MLKPGHFIDAIEMQGIKGQGDILETLARIRQFLPDDVWNLVLDNIVVACVDVAARYREKIIFGKRINQPWKGGWAFVGGRMRTGESFEQTGSRHIMRDLGLCIKASRLEFVRTDSYVWSMRAQAPDRGCHMQGTTYTVTLTDKEKNAIRRQGDFSEIVLFSAQDILLHRDLIHPAHQHAAFQVLLL